MTEYNLIKAVALIVLACIMVGLVIYVADDTIQDAKHEAQDAAEAQEKLLATQFQKGIDQGYPQGVYDAVMGLIAQAEQDGMVQVPMDENTTYPLFNTEGCGQQVSAELQARRCQIVCP